MVAIYYCSTRSTENQLADKIEGWRCKQGGIVAGHAGVKCCLPVVTLQLFFTALSICIQQDGRIFSGVPDC